MMKILLIIIGLIYVLSPYDLLPDFIIGWGWLDDLIILGLLWRYFKTLSQKQFKAQNFYHQSRQAHENSHARFQETGKAKDPYTVLNVDRDASPEEIKNAYKQLAGKYHPDKVLHLGEEFKKLAEERFKEIQEAYRELIPK
jgi:DnaJ like chaperone protein